MVKVEELVQWLRANAVCKTLQNPSGFVNGDMLLKIAEEVKAKEPFDYVPIFPKRASIDSDE